MQECKVCGRIDCQIGWHLEVKSDGKTEQSQGQERTPPGLAGEGQKESKDEKVPSEHSSDVKQRWDRKAYNAYQREYMRKYRAKNRT